MIEWRPCLIDNNHEEDESSQDGRSEACEFAIA
jgi:hypothetical protein